MQTVDPSRPVHDALRESLAEIELVFQPTLPSFSRDRVQTAAGKEHSVAEFLESYFPPDWSVKKGPIYDNHGKSSAEVDCALCVPQHPRCRTPMRDLILAEGVFAAIEVKPDISSLGEAGEFARSLRQALTVKRIKRTINFGPRPAPSSWPPEAHRIPYIIFSGKVPNLEKSAHFMESEKQKNEWSPWDLPDIVLGYPDGLLYHAPEASVCSIAPFFKDRGCGSGEAYAWFPTGRDTLISFLALLYSFASPQPQISAPILREYLLPIAIPGEVVVLRRDANAV